MAYRADEKTLAKAIHQIFQRRWASRSLIIRFMMIQANGGYPNG
jgi:hypothetical protein